MKRKDISPRVYFGERKTGEREKYVGTRRSSGIEIVTHARLREKIIIKYYTKGIFRHARNAVLYSRGNRHLREHDALVRTKHAWNVVVPGHANLYALVLALLFLRNEVLARVQLRVRDEHVAATLRESAHPFREGLKQSIRGTLQ